MENRLRTLITVSEKMIAAGMANIRNSEKYLDGFGRNAKRRARIWMAIIW